MFVYTDRNYTQGYNFEFVSPKLAKNPFNYLLFKFSNNNNKYGLSIEGIGFTPQDIGSHDIQFRDRPFASATVIKSFVIATNQEQKSRLSTGFSIGMIGQATLGKETQVAIHKLTGSTIPNGWKHQIRNDLLVNYQVDFEKEIVAFKYFSFNGDAKLKLGTLFSNASIGSNIVVGKFNKIYHATNGSRFQCYGFIQPILNFVAFDATLQGGVFNNSSPYTVLNKDINRLTYQLNYGLIFKLKKYYLEISQTYLTKEYEFGSEVRWGSVRFGLMLL